MAASKPTLSGTDLVHADDHVPHGLEVAPSISVTTSKSDFDVVVSFFDDVYSIAFRNPTPWQPGQGLDDEADPRNPARHVYSRYTQPTSTRAEHVLSKINVSTYCVLLCGDSPKLPERICLDVCLRSCSSLCSTFNLYTSLAS